MSKVVRAARILAWIVVAAATSVLVGWQLDIQVLKSILPGIVNMNPLTATCFILAAASLLLQSSPSPGRTVAGRLLGVGVATLHPAHLELCKRHRHRHGHLAVYG